jgi:hypothetical protein
VHRLRTIKSVALDRSHENLIISSFSFGTAASISIQQESEKPVLGDNFERAFIAIRHQWSKCYRKGGESGWATSTLALAIEKSQADD